MGHLAHELRDYVPPGTVKFTILREPVDRIISHYYYVRTDQQNYLHDRVINENIQLEDYASSLLSLELRNWYTTHFSGLSLDEAESAPEASVRAAVKNILENYDVVGFQDDLAAAVRALIDVARLYRRFDTKRVNETIGRVKTSDVPERAKQAIAEANYLDVRLYARLRESSHP